MKKIALILLSLVTLQANAQKTTTYSYEDTQARALDMLTKGYVKPLTVEVEVSNTQAAVTWSSETSKSLEGGERLSAQKVADMQNDPVNIRAWGLYYFTKDYNCDVAVAPTFHLYTKPGSGGDMFILEIKAFPGKFKNWKTMTNEDLQWINSTQVKSTGDSQQIDAVVKPTKTR